MQKTADNEPVGATLHNQNIIMIPKMIFFLFFVLTF